MHPPIKPLFIIVLGLLTAFGSISIDMYLPAFIHISQDYNVSIDAVQLSLSAFFIGFSLGQLFYGPITDRFGRKNPLYFGIILYIIASIGCILSPTINALIFFRFLQALGGCSGVIISRAMVRDCFTENHAARVFSLLMLVMGAAPILAPLAGGMIAEVLNWRWIFGVTTCFGVICLCLTFFLLDETLPVERRTVQLNLKATLHNYKAVLRDRSFIGYAISGSLCSGGLFAYVAGSPFVVINLYGVPPDRYGWFFGANAFGLIATSQANSWLLARYSFDRILKSGYLFISACAFYLLLAVWFGFSLWLYAAGLFFYIGIMGIIGPNYNAGALGNQANRAGSAAALLGTFQFLSATLSSSLVSFFHNGTSMPMTLIMIGCVTSSLIVYFVTSPYKHRKEVHP